MLEQGGCPSAGEILGWEAGLLCARAQEKENSSRFVAVRKRKKEEERKKMTSSASARWLALC